MSSARPLEPSFEALVSQGFGQSRQGAVVVVESKGLPAPRVRWLERQLAALLPDSTIHLAGDALFVAVVPEAGPAETWLLVERMRRQLRESGWERAIVGSATWPVQGSSPMDVVAAALASLFDEGARVEYERGQHEVWLELDEHSGFHWASVGELLSG